MSLFQTNAWQRAWWKTWGNTPGFSLLVAGGAGASGLYLHHYRFRHLLPVTCLQFVGTNYRRLSTPRTEYNRLPRNPAQRRQLLEDARWTEAVFADMRADSADLAWLKDLAEQSGWLWRVVGEDRAYSIATGGSFEDYLGRVGKNTRLRLYNRRKVLESCGEVRLSRAWPEGVDDFFRLLNSFHQQRWGQPCFNEQSLAFHRQFLEDLAGEGGRADLSVMAVDGKPVSVLYNVRFGETVYNLQSGFLADFHPKLALGTLHLGYAVEAAFKANDVELFDMLAGTGKNEDYKSRLATGHEDLISVMVVRSPLFKRLYRLKG